MALKGKKKKAIEILKQKAGNVTLTTEALKISRAIFYVWKKEDPEFAQAVEDIEEGLIDFAESKLMKKINDDDNTAIIFFLKTKGRKRGYIERQEIEHDGAPPLPSVINVKVHK